MVYRRIVVGTDGSPTAERAVAAAAGLAALGQGRLVVVAAHGGDGEVLAAHGGDGEVDAAHGGDGDGDAARHHAEEGVRRAAELAAQAGATDVVEVVAAGGAAEIVLGTAEAHDADLVVVGSQGMTDQRRFVLGSVANGVSHHAGCDVLVVHTG
jgi:nucleotide-binding universal stress UspA family protein